MDNITLERSVLQRGGMISVIVENDNIYQLSGWNMQKVPVGVTMNKYNELKQVADGYYNVLIEKGILEKPKTPEEIAQEQQKLMNEMFNQMKAMQDEIKSLKLKSSPVKEEKVETNEIMFNAEPEVVESKIEEATMEKTEEKKHDRKLLTFK